MVQFNQILNKALMHTGIALFFLLMGDSNLFLCEELCQLLGGHAALRMPGTGIRVLAEYCVNIRTGHQLVVEGHKLLLIQHLGKMNNKIKKLHILLLVFKASCFQQMYKTHTNYDCL